MACIGIGLFIGSAILMHYCSLPVAKACKPKRRVLLKVWVAVRSLMVKAKIAWSFYQVSKSIAVANSCVARVPLLT